MLWVTPTDLDSFREYRLDEEKDVEWLMKRLRREEALPPIVHAGSALHKALETAPRDGGELSEFESEGIRFVVSCDEEIVLQPFREFRHNRIYDIDGVEIRVSGKVDAFDGITVEDHKLTAHFDCERYYDKYQWRLYLSIFRAKRFVYNIFEVNEPCKGRPAWEIKAFHRLPLFRYPELERDVRNELALFIEFAKQKLPERLAA